MENNTETFDKRKITAKENLKKAREKKLQMLKEQNELKKKAEVIKYSDSDSESNSSEEEIVYVKPKDKEKKIKKRETNDLSEIKAMLALMNEQNKKKKVKKVYVPQVVQSEPITKIVPEIRTVYQKDEMINHMKQKILNF